MWGDYFRKKLHESDVNGRAGRADPSVMALDCRTGMAG